MNKITFTGNVRQTDSERFSRGYEIILPAESGEITLKNGKILYGADKIVVIPPFMRHILKGNADDLHIVIEQALLPFREIVVVEDDLNGGIAHSARQAAFYFQSDLEKKDVILSALGGLIVSYLTAFTKRNEFSPVVELVRADIAKGVSDCTFSLEDSLKKLPLNYDYVRKLFKKEVGATPHEYLMRERMELARGLMDSGISNQYSEFSVSQIAEACGFSEPLYFSRVFKKYFGTSPSAYIKNGKI